MLRGLVTLSLMGQRIYRKHFLLEWRKKRKLSLRKMANLMEAEPGVPLISHAQLQRIEVGEQPYTQPILEAAALVLGITVCMILDVNPDTEGDLMSLLSLLDGEKRQQAIEFLRFLARK